MRTQDGGFINMNLHALDSSRGEDKILCVYFALAKPRILVPGILENVKFPHERTVNESDIEETILWHEQQGSFRGQRVPHQTRHLERPPENESSGLVAGSGWGGRGRGRGRGGPYNNHPNGSHSMGYPTMPGPTSTYNHPNGSHSPRPNSGAGASWRARCDTTSPVSSNLYRGGPCYPGNPHPMAGPTSPYNRPRRDPGPHGFRPRGAVNSSYQSRVNLEGNAWSSPQVSLQNLRVSSAASQGAGFGRGRASYGVDDYHGSRGGRGRGHFRPHYGY